LSSLIGLESAIDLVAQASSEGPDGLGLGVARSQALGNISLSETRTAELGDRDPV
jgi:hypothetical protein